MMGVVAGIGLTASDKLPNKTKIRIKLTFHYARPCGLRLM